MKARYVQRMKNIIVGLISVLGLAGSVIAEQDGVTTYNEEDAAPAIRVKWNGTASTNLHASFTSTTTTIVLAEGVVSTTITMPLSKSWTNIINEINGFTNASGVCNFKAELLNAELFDTISNKVQAVATTDIQDGKWHEVMKWDTSVALTFDVSRPAELGGYRVNKIYGEPNGTGNITAQAWVDGKEVYYKTIVSPVYVYSSTGTTYVASDEVHDLDKDVNIYVGKNQRFHLRLTRATTATVGGVGFSTENK